MFQWLRRQFADGFAAIDEAVARSRRFTIRPHEETEWGTMFAIVDPDGKIIGYDRRVPAEQRCAALNRGRESRGC